MDSDKTVEMTLSFEKDYIESLKKRSGVENNADLIREGLALLD